MKNTARQWIFLPVGVLVTLVVVELVVRATDRVERFLDGYLYTESSLTEIHEPDPDPHLLFRMRANTVSSDGTAHINSQGARGPERPIDKAPGTTRIFCFGGSNAFGAELRDDETWPARLEQRLRPNNPGIEVWNYGTSAYVASQMAALANRVVSTGKPDILIFGFANIGVPAFLRGAPKLPILRATPSLWFTYIFDERPPASWFAPLLGRSHLVTYNLLRYGCAADPRKWQRTEYEPDNIRFFRAFASAHPDLKIGAFLNPAAIDDGESGYEPYLHDPPVPVLRLRADGLPSEYHQQHPPPPVMVWYADHLAAWLADLGWVQRDLTAGVAP